MPREARAEELHPRPRDFPATPPPPRNYGATHWITRVRDGAAPPPQREDPMAESPDAPVAAGDETLIEHPEHAGAIMRIPAVSFNPGQPKLWPAGPVPWVDGAGQPIPRRSAPTPPAPGR